MAQHRDPADRPFRRFCATGDPAALGEVFDRTAGRLLRVSIWLTGDRTDAEDLLQRTFLKAIETRQQFRRTEPVLPWLMGLLGNEARRMRRDRERAARQLPPRDRVADPEVTVIANELAEQVRSVGERLGAPYDDVLRLHLEAGLNCAEIAARLDRPAGTVRTQLMRALDALRRRLPSGFVAGFAVSAAAATANASAPAVRAAVVAAARQAVQSPGAEPAPNGPCEGALTMKKFVLITAPVLTAIAAGSALVPILREDPPAAFATASSDAAPAAATTDAPAPASAPPTERVPAPASRFAPPRVDAPGTPPAREPDLRMAADGRVVDSLPAKATSEQRAFLHIDRDVAWSRVTSLLGDLCDRGFRTVQFACVRGGGAPGCFTMALPSRSDARPALHMRLHHDRAGVAASSVEPLLRRIVRGRQAIVESIAEPDDPHFPLTYTLGVEAPDDASFERVLGYVAAACAAGVDSVWCTSRGRPTSHSSDDRLAVDLGPAPRIVVRDAPGAGGLRAATADGVFGCTVAPDAPSPEPPRSGAGGRIGSRGRRRTSEASEGPTATELALDWLVAQQRGDGGFRGDDGRDDVEATALVLLALLADGQSMHRGRHHEALAAGTGWLLANQAADGALAPPGPHTVSHHALATTALAEAFGLSMCLELRGGVQDALAWLHEQQREDGGFAAGLPGGSSGIRATAAVGIAVDSYDYFCLQRDSDSPLDAKAIGRWLHEACTTTDDTDLAAGLFGMIFTSTQVEKADPRWQAATTLPKRVRIDDPRATYWTSLIAMQLGGETWQSWHERLSALERDQLPTGDLRGSWRPSHGCSRVVTTALDTLSLQSRHRYSRLIR